MRPIFKQVEVSVPHCPKCGECLQGNNSFMYPWQCFCGVWTAAQKNYWDGEYEITSKELLTNNK